MKKFDLKGIEKAFLWAESEFMLSFGEEAGRPGLFFRQGK